MKELERQSELLEQTNRLIADTERELAENPERIGLNIDLKSLRKMYEQLLAQSVEVTGNLVGVDTVRRSFRLEAEEGTMIQGRLADTIEGEYPLQVPHRYRAELKAVRRGASRSGKELTRYILSDLSPVD